jgi:L-threonylcarbamoyladenylate synthase
MASESRIGATDPAAVADAVRILRAGGVVGLPTETVYGLAADAENDAAVARIFAIKGRPAGHPLIVHLAAASELPAWSRDANDAALALADRFWPGPLTLVVPRGMRVSHRITGGQETVALRVPAHPVARAVLAAFGGGLAAPSANRYGRVSPTTARHVRDDLGTDVDLVLDGGPSAIGVESTIVDVSGTVPRILRLGAVTEADIRETLDLASVRVQTDGSVRAPGTTARHYAPEAFVVIAERHRVAAAAADLTRRGKRTETLVIDDPVAFARTIYAELRRVDAEGYDAVVIAEPVGDGLPAALRDRIARAAHRDA